MSFTQIIFIKWLPVSDELNNFTTHWKFSFLYDNILLSKWWACLFRTIYFSLFFIFFFILAFFHFTGSIFLALSHLLHFFHSYGAFHCRKSYIFSSKFLDIIALIFFLVCTNSSAFFSSLDLSLSWHFPIMVSKISSRILMAHSSLTKTYG